MNTEPSRIIATITAAITATVGIITLTEVWSAEVGGAVTAAIGAWVLAAGEILRSRVTPNTNVALTTDEADALAARPPEFQ